MENIFFDGYTSFSDLNIQTISLDLDLALRSPGSEWKNSVPNIIRKYPNPQPYILRDIRFIWRWGSIYLLPALLDHFIVQYLYISELEQTQATFGINLEIIRHIIFFHGYLQNFKNLSKFENKIRIKRIYNIQTYIELL